MNERAVAEGIVNRWIAAFRDDPMGKNARDRLVDLIHAALEQQLAAEQAAHDQIATICFRVGADTTDGTSISAVLSLADIVIDFRQQLAAKDAEIARLRARMEQDADSWDEKNYGVETPKECSADYIYGYNAGCAETFRACAYRTSTIGAALAETPAAPEVK